MKKLVVLIVAGVIALGSISAWAGGSCCASKKKNGYASCTDHMSALNLTDNQKAKIADIEAACKAAGSNKESCAKAKEEISAVLTDEQRTQWDQACAGKTDS